jgi:thiol:disulfide interchange protein
MPFGVIYGALFFVVLAIGMIATSSGPGGAALAATRMFIAPAALLLALGLLLRMQWARWAGLFLAALVAWNEMRASLVAESIASYLWLLGALLTFILLAIPATGDPRRGTPEGREPASRLGRVLGLLACCCLAGMIGTLWWGGYRTGPEPEEDRAPVKLPFERVAWTDFGRGLELAAAENKPMMVAFVTGWCGYCRKMDRETWKDPEVLDALQEMVAVKVDAEEGVERNGYRGVDLAARYGVGTYPTMLLIDGSGRELARTVGYKGPRDYLRWLRNR